MATIMAIPALAQNKLNNVADSVLGEYESVQEGDAYKVRVTKKADGTYKAQIFWVKNDRDAKGNKELDVKNPDKSLRNVPVDKVVLIDGLKYMADKKVWGGTKIYDPQRGIKANVTVKFEADGRLCLRGTILGIGESAYWTRIK